MYPLAETILWFAVIYLLVGGILAVGFAAFGLGRVLPHAEHITIGARIASLPAAALLWPAVLFRLRRPG